MAITYKRFSELTYEEGHALFLKGFEGYFIPMKLTFDQFTTRFGNEGLSPALSVVALEEGVPFGFVLQGIRKVGEMKISWNGGTGIIPSHRGKKLAIGMMEEAERVLLENGVTLQTLEALSQNEPAIALYERMGYSLTETLRFLSGKGKLVDELPPLRSFTIERVPAHHPIGETIFPKEAPWQCIPSHGPRAGGEIVLLKKDEAVTCAVLLRKNYATGDITLFQVSEGEGIELLLAHALEMNEEVNRNTYNLSEKCDRSIAFLMANGFEDAGISQVLMHK
ncbi:GNAT family N-acetyltransferase [Paenisporosarcina cavernae]|uniref:GNAT family N-acetyltransferase n=1 Tax=Paenisporosarcina cavernae TaxID=2320858 RepID=A0A385YUA4_9BACL|nr:GNAT family N-acetyltransferase [Paenisporosarcina cavernae]AYC30061.1 GNAT family N-acetyltransferase [Paenisporosarcina cavernae]